MLQSKAGYIDARPLPPTRQNPLATHGRTIHEGQIPPIPTEKTGVCPSPKPPFPVVRTRLAPWMVGYVQHPFHSGRRSDWAVRRHWTKPLAR